MPIIEMANICKLYDNANTRPISALANIDLVVNAGECVAIMGPSGSGKSSLVNIIGLLDRHSTGVYMFDGQDTSQLNERQLARLRNETIGFVFQQFNLMQDRTVVENVMLPLVYSNEPRRFHKERASHYLEELGLYSYRNHYPGQLSGGQQQRVAVARALVGEPAMIVADEPTGSLDEDNAEALMRLFTTVNAEGITVIVVTHDNRVARIAKRLVQICNSVLCYDGPMY